jgi:V/A-type H+/Na+-transporting ATPase subunit C
MSPSRTVREGLYVGRIESGLSAYAYANARIRGMRSHLMTREDMNALIALGDSTRLLHALSGTEYGPDIESSTLHGRGTSYVDKGLSRNMVRAYRKVLGFISPSGLAILETLLGRWDVFNMKTILRGKHMHLMPEDIETGLVPVASLAPADLEELCRCADIRVLVDTLATWRVPYARVLGRVYPEFVKSGDLAVLELALDRYYFEWAHERLAGRNRDLRKARQVLGVQTDTTNLLTVFRAQKADVDPAVVDTYFMPGGMFIKKALFDELVGKSDIDQVLNALHRTPYGPPLESAAQAYLEDNAISVLERGLEDHMMRKAIAMGVGDPFGIGIAISYLWAKANEVTNLRVIVKCVASGLPEGRIRRELIFV